MITVKELVRTQVYSDGPSTFGAILDFVWSQSGDRDSLRCVVGMALTELIREGLIELDSDDETGTVFFDVAHQEAAS